MNSNSTHTHIFHAANLLVSSIIARFTRSIKARIRQKDLVITSK